jgi:hypothetical protein
MILTTPPCFGMGKLCLRSYIETRHLPGLTFKEIHEELTTANGQGTVSYRTVAHWVHRFSSRTKKRTDAVKEIVNAGPHTSIDYLVYNLDISHHRR